ncbi:MAG: acetyl-CoA carboxylase carboxyltransferase subunit alpha [Ignavibacteriaceae bacterium]|jgi:acetyl-coenzyme A carboxylase carboxyl transferase subunit alpha|nr:MAG: acetyl-CoA carboxylase carboxyltransferase subunit alpha [Chlorobiota bacterium]KXK03188.1 MAG: acetyl-CoA carboxylase subunit alpha [Chlorobi bacterium OLB4]MBV6399646.1 Acetyl-coenzyme A carboxylase carboxyl transferase subunit alpha [Ignavibacteria bacterium]MCC6885638.1 acetyl-CoA carboxylase carboxyltransferase subunit alpha [Ignavibacteriales bacterium]MCE7953802.1 acetyl-CoA carboxylase carboxyltransferase subunit alpha [Chlorobi bacterium CHB7]MDL1887736.1 acetyl-CoA carboxylas
MANITLEFEKPIVELEQKIDEIKEMSSGMDISNELAKLEKKVIELRTQIFSNLTPWEVVQLARHPERPFSLDYIFNMTTDFIELHGDRLFGDDKAIVGGFARLENRTVMIIGQQKGRDTKSNLYRNFGMPNPEGYRKALRLMKLAEKFEKPVITLIDTPGAYPGIGAEERGQAEAIAKNLFEMAKLKVPIIVVIIGEGASGGALGIGVGDRVLMLEYCWYSVISPESCSSILWRSWEHKEKAAEQLKLTANDLLELGIIDRIIPEPPGGAHRDHVLAAKLLKKTLIEELDQISKIKNEKFLENRIEKFSAMGFFKE